MNVLLNKYSETIVCPYCLCSSLLGCSCNYNDTRTGIHNVILLQHFDNVLNWIYIEKKPLPGQNLDEPESPKNHQITDITNKEQVSLFTSFIMIHSLILCFI